MEYFFSPSKKVWGFHPLRRVKGWVLAILAMLALWAVRGSGLLRFPAYAAFVTLPPAFATWQGFRTLCAFTLCTKERGSE